MSDAVVHIERLETYEPAAVDAALDKVLVSLGGLRRFVKAGQTVLIKPNLISSVPLSQTNRQLVVAMARRVMKAGAHPVISDSPAWGSLKGVASKSGLAALADGAGIAIRKMHRPCRVETGFSNVYRHLTVDRLALEADVIINMPKLKVHRQMTVTAGVKNLFGCVPGKRKAWWHFWVNDRRDYFAYMLLETYQLLKPALTIIDAVEAMEGSGPIRGRARKVAALVAGRDAVAAEAVCCTMIGLDRRRVPVLCAAEKLGIGQPDLDRIEVTGQDPQHMQIKDFDLGQLLPIGFSLPRVVRSVIRQATLVGRERLRRVGL